MTGPGGSQGLGLAARLGLGHRLGHGSVHLRLRPLHRLGKLGADGVQLRAGQVCHNGPAHKLEEVEQRQVAIGAHVVEPRLVHHRHKLLGGHPMA